MSDVDRYQNAEEEVAQMRQDEANAAQAEALAELQQEPLADTASKPTRRITLTLDQVTAGPNMRVGTLPEVQELAVSIIETGLLHPPLVRETDADEAAYELVAGFRRFAAMGLVDDANGEPQSWEFDLREGISRREALTLQFSENFHQSKPEPLVFARAVRAIMIEDSELTAAEVSRMTGAPAEWMRKALRLLDLPAVAELVDAGNLSFTAADMVGRAIRTGKISEAEGVELAGQAADGELSAGELKKAVGYIPPAPENYDEISKQLDEARWAGANGAKNDPAGFSVGADAEQADWESGGLDSEPGYSSTRSSVSGARPDAPSPIDDVSMQDAGSQLMDAGDMNVPGEDLDAYLLGMLLTDVAPDEHRENLGIPDKDGAAYQYAFGLTPFERLAALRNLSLRMLAEDPAPPREMHHHLQDA